MSHAKCLRYQSVNVSPSTGLSIPRIGIGWSLGKALPNNDIFVLSRLPGVYIDKAHESKLW